MIRNWAIYSRIELEIGVTYKEIYYLNSWRAEITRKSLLPIKFNKCMKLLNIMKRMGNKRSVNDYHD